MGDSPVRYVTVQPANGGTMTDLRPYLERLDEHVHELNELEDHTD